LGRAIHEAPPATTIVILRDGRQQELPVEFAPR